MSYYNRGNPYGNHNYSPRSNSNSFNDGVPNAKRKRGGRWNKNNAANIEPLFKEPVTPPARSPGAGSSRRTGRENTYRSNVAYGKRQDNLYADPQQYAESSWYWDNYYSSCKSWHEKHQLAYYRSRCLALEFENQMLFEQINSLIEENCIFAMERGEMPAMRLPEMAGGKREDASGEKPTPADKQSPTKNQEKSRKKAQESSNSQDFELNGGNVKNEDAKSVAVKREEELEQLYGKNSTMIHKLETSLQLKFNQKCDTHKPEMWMAIPLNQGATVAE